MINRKDRWNVRKDKRIDDIQEGQMECQKGQMYKYMVRQIREMNIQMVGQIGQMVRQKGEIKDIWLDRWLDRQLNRRLDGQLNRYLDKQ